MEYGQIINVFNSYPMLIKEEKSNDRVSFLYPESHQRGNVIATEISLAGNGYIQGKYLNLVTSRKYKIDPRGWISFKEMNESQLRELIEDALVSMSPSNKEINHKLEVKLESSIIKHETVPSGEFSELVRSCLYNWLGYGNINSPIWFIGMEEGGAEIWRAKTQTLESSLRLRRQFNVSEDFVDIWENRYQVSLNSFKGANVWNYMAAFLLCMQGEQVTSELIENFVFQSKKLGRYGGDHFLCELFPLPKRNKKDIDVFSDIWRTTDMYYEEVKHNRFKLISDNLILSEEVRLVVCYEKVLLNLLSNNFAIQEVNSWNFKGQKFILLSLRLPNNRIIYFLSTPFFGNGQISYEGIQYTCQRLNEVI